MNTSLVAPFLLYSVVPSISLPAPSNVKDVILPAGASNHGDPNLLCIPVKWTYIAMFFVSNYVTHDAAVVSPPGYGLLDEVWIVIEALLFPAVGGVRGIQAIRGLAIFTSSDLKMACRANAVYVVVEERMRTGCEARFTKHRGNMRIYNRDTDAGRIWSVHPFIPTDL
ncbi:hypothetical protein B0O99DRAFT_693594 [Bisporella sp. PMI_857]|nr:hypothetical protein B0O99DRAFT_693594 [Bisporella sp. PMI_857]